MASASAEAEAHKQRGNELLKAGDLAEAAAAYGEAIKAEPSIPAYWSNRSHALLRLGDASAALADADEVAKLQPEWAKAHYRRAQALKELGRPHEAAEACEAGLKVVVVDNEKKELRKLREVMAAASAAIALAGWWNGTVSKELGGFLQEFCFLPEGELRCCVYGQELPGTYALRDVETSEGGALRGGVDVALNGEKVPYLFRVRQDGGSLDLCCPMTSPPERPRTFDGPGYLGMKQGREQSGDELAGMSEGQRVTHYLRELLEALESRVPEGGGGAAGDRTADKLLEEVECGGTVNSQQLVGPETLEDKAKKMAHEHHVQALRVKYSDAVDEAAQKLIKGELEAFTAYPEEAQELQKMLRRITRNKPEPEEAQEDDQAAPTSATPPEPAPEPPLAAEVEATQASGQAPEAARPETIAAPALEKPPPASLEATKSGGGCLSGCFAAFQRR